jgi:capsular polysaccharide transport system ATP-binding protein
MLTFHDVDKRFRLRDGYKVILDHVSLHIPACNVGILGANGAGKSTLLRMISGADYPDSGMIECHRKVSFPLGFAGSFKGTLTGIENTLFVSRIYGQDTEAVVEYVKEFSQLGEQLYMPLQTYSSGMRARLAFGVSLAIDFEMYLVDEITAVGDA